MEIDWKEVAIRNDLSIEQFNEQIFITAACIAVIDLDNNKGDLMKFTCSDSIGKIVLTVTRED